MKEKWIEFEHYPPKQGKKTSLWIIKTKTDKLTIGLVKWHSAWRKYAFFPIQDSIWEEDCLKDISEFMEEETRKQRIHQ